MRSAARRPAHEILRGVLLACGFKIVRLPLGVYDSFAAAGVDVRCVAPRAVIDFFARFQNGSCHCGLPVLPADVATTPFGSNVALKVVHDYCSQVRTIHPFYRSNDTLFLFFSRPRSEGWPHHGRTFSIYPCPLSF